MYEVTLLIKFMKTMKMVLMLLLMMSIKVMMRDDEVRSNIKEISDDIDKEC